jgi:hypothetical protein
LFEVTKETRKERSRKGENEKDNKERRTVVHLPFSCVEAEFVGVWAMLAVHLKFNPLSSTTAAIASDAIATDACSYARESSL